MILGLDLINEVNDRIGWPQLESLESPVLSAEQRKMIRLLNRVVRTLGGWHPWPHLRAEGTILTVADKVSDTTSGAEQWVTATNGSKQVTIANGDFTNAYEGWAFQVDGDEVVYRIDRVLSPTVLRLENSWVNDSIVAATDEKTFTAAMDRYSLATDFDRPVDDWDSFFEPYGIKPLSPDEFREKRRARGGGIQVGEPLWYTVYGMNDTDTAPVLHFDPYPGDARLLYYPYQRVHPKIDTDEDWVRFPHSAHEMVIEAMLSQAYRDYEDDSRMQQSLMDFIRDYNMATAKTVTSPKLKLSPSGRTRQSIKRAYGRGTRVDWGEYFDRADNTGLD